MKGSDAIGLGEYLLLSLRPLHSHNQNEKRKERPSPPSSPPTLFLGLVLLFLYFDMHNHLARDVGLAQVVQHLHHQLVG